MSLYRSFATVGGLTLVSRVLGFVRDIIFAAVLGSGPVAEAFVVAFRFPNLFRRWFGEGAFNAAFVPLFARRLQGEAGSDGDGRAAARRFAEEALSGLLLVLVLLSTACMLAMPWLMYALAPGFAADPAKFDLAVVMSQIAFPYLLCMSLVALLSGVLNSLGRFAASSSISIVLNVVLIAAMLLALAGGHRNDPQAGLIMAWGIFAAGLLQLAMLYWGARRSGMALLPRWPRWTGDVAELVRLGIPGIVAGGATQINIVIGGMIASLQTGAVTYLYYADRLYELPLAIIGIAIGVVLLPDISRHLRAGDAAAANDAQNRGLEFAALFTLPAAVALAVVPGPIISVLFERGAFKPSDTVAVSAALMFFAIGLPAFVAIKVLQPGFFAREDTRTPMRFAAISLAVNTLGSLALFFLFRQLGWMPHTGIAIATTVGAWINVAQLWMALSARGHYHATPAIRRSLPRILASSAIMGIALWFAADALTPWLAASNPLWIRSTALAALISGAMALYLALVVGSGAVRLRDLGAALRRRQTRKKDELVG